MSKRMIALGLALLSSLVLGYGLAKHGADDPAGHGGGHGADDPPGHTMIQPGGNAPFIMARRGRGGHDDPAGHDRRGRGQDDPPGHDRHGRGADDPPNHG